MLVLASVAVTNVWIAVAVRGGARDDAAALPARSVAIVPGTHTAPHRPMPLLRQRLAAALQLYREGHVRTILISGVDTEDDPEVSVMRAWLEREGVPARDIVADVGDCDHTDDVRKLCAQCDPDATRTLVVIGDSHARAWIPAFNRITPAGKCKAYYLVKPLCRTDPDTFAVT